MGPAIPIERTLNKLGKRLSASEAESALEIAYLAMAADRSFRDEEYAAFARIAAHVLEHTEAETIPYQQRQTALGADVHSRTELLLGQFARALDVQDVSQRLKHAGSHLERPAARDFAFQLAYLMSISDFDTNDAETRFEDRIRQALELSDDWAEALVDEVLGAIDSP